MKCLLFEKNHAMLLSILLLAPARLLPAQENAAYPERGLGWVDYYRQEVTITCEDTVASAEGRYYLRNLTDGMITMGIQYPFLVDEFHPFPHRVTVDGYSFQSDSASIRFTVSLRPREEESIRITHDQRHFSKCVTYLLSSTRHSSKSIEQANFVISVPVHWNTTISLIPDSIGITAGRHTYYISRQNFSPTDDLVITWK